MNEFGGRTKKGEMMLLKSQKLKEIIRKNTFLKISPRTNKIFKRE